MKVLKIMPNQPPLEREMDNTLEALQSEVGGYIEAVSLSGDIVIICNEDGINLKFPVSRTLVFTSNSGTVYDVPIHGVFIICGTDGEEFRGLSEKEIKDLKKQFSTERIRFA